MSFRVRTEQTPGGCALVRGTDGGFYGGTGGGGNLSLNGRYGDGTVFKMTPQGALTTLVSFQGTNGAGLTGLVQGRDGNFYGTT